MYFIVREGKEKRRGPYSDENPEYRRTFGETLEKIEGMHPRDLSPERRLAIKQMRFQGRRPELVAKSAAIRAYMTKEINR
jgi:hypothetical protein